MRFSLVNLLLGAAVWSSSLGVNARPLDSKDAQFKGSRHLSARTAPPLPPGAVPIDVDSLTTRFEATLETKLKVKLDDNAEFIFHTAIRDTEPIEQTINKFKTTHLSPRVAHQIGDVIDPTWKSQTLPAYADVKPSQEWRWWAAVSAAFARAASGKVYVIVPLNRPLDKSRIDGGSHWWSYELPILTAPGGKVTQIYRSDYDSVKKTFSEPKLIWKKGDKQIGTLQDVNIEPQKSTGPDVWGPEVRAPLPVVPRPPVRSMLDV